MKTTFKILLTIIWIFIVIVYATWVFQHLSYYKYPDGFWYDVLENFNIFILGFIGALSPGWGIYGILYIWNKHNKYDTTNFNSTSSINSNNYTN